MEKAQLELREDLTEKEIQELDESIQMIKNFESQGVGSELIKVAKQIAEDTEKRVRKYKSNRLEGIKSGWSDFKVLQYVTEKVDFRTSHPDLREALEKRMDEITNKLMLWKFLNEKGMFEQMQMIAQRYYIHKRDKMAEEELAVMKFMDKNHENNEWYKKLIGEK